MFVFFFFFFVKQKPRVSSDEAVGDSLHLDTGSCFGPAVSDIGGNVILGNRAHFLACHVSVSSFGGGL